MQDEFSPFKGGESEALKRLTECMKKKVAFIILQIFASFGYLYVASDEKDPVIAGVSMYSM